MYLDRQEAIEIIERIEKSETKHGRLKTAGGLYHYKNFLSFKKDLEPATFGVKTIDVNERTLMMIQSRISKLDEI